MICHKNTAIDRMQCEMGIKCDMYTEGFDIASSNLHCGVMFSRYESTLVSSLFSHFSSSAAVLFPKERG
jgi:hypothetical protein